MKKLDKYQQRIYNNGFKDGVRLCLEDNDDAIRIGRAILEVVGKHIAKEIELHSELDQDNK